MALRPPLLRRGARVAMRTYELWDHETGNRIGAYPSELAALQDVARDVAEYGDESYTTVGLVASGGDQPSQVIAEGSVLAIKARTAVSGTASS